MFFLHTCALYQSTASTMCSLTPPLVYDVLFFPLHHRPWSFSVPTRRASETGNRNSSQPPPIADATLHLQWVWPHVSFYFITHRVSRMSENRETRGSIFQTLVRLAADCKNHKFQS
uniref:Secreted protein n=1 Tax=Amphiprion ocellaris TaxID=80972 RepID=A0AAQ5ZH77_AMPOC